MTLKTALYGPIISLGVLLSPILTLAADTAVFTIPGNAYASLGLAGSTYDYAVAEFYAPQFTQAVCSVDINLRKTGSPTDFLELTIIEGGATPDAGGSLVGSQIAVTSTIAATHNFDFGGYCLTLIPGKNYWFKIARTGAADSSNYYEYALNTADTVGYADKWRANTSACGGWCEISQELAITIKGVDFGGGSLDMPFAPPTSTTSSASFTMTCDPNDSVFQYSLCKLFLALFVPPEGTFEVFDGIQTAVEDKPPIGYFTLIQGALTGVSSTAATSSYQMPDITALNAPLFDKVRPTARAVMWTGWAAWLVHFIRGLAI